MYQPPGQGERFQYSCSRRPHMRSRSFSHHLQRQIEMPEAIHTELGNRTYSGRQTNYESNSQYGRTSGRGFRLPRNQGFEPRRAARPWSGGDSSYSERGPLQPSTRYDVGQDVDRSQHNNNRNGWMDNPRGRSHTRGARGRLRERVKGGRQWGQRETFDIRQRREFNMDDFVSITDTTLLTETLLTCLTELEEFMNSPSVSQENTVKLLKVLKKVTDCEEQRESVLQILRVVCASRFLDIHLALLLLNLTTNVDVADSSGESIIDIVEMVCTLFSDICSRLPSYSAKCSLTLTAILTQPQMTSLLGNRPDLAQDLKTLTLECERCMAVSRSSHEQQDSGERKRDRPNDDDDMPPENFECLSIFPNSSDLDWTEKPFLRPNKIGGAFKSRANYLDVQFRLLREDYIRPLRNGIKLYRETLETGKSMEKNFDIRLYHGVRVVGLVCGDTMEHLLHFDVTRLSKVRWQSSKRLIYGSLLCLSKNDFETNYFAVVTKREVRYLRKGVIQVRFESRLGEIVDVSPSEQFVMAETVTFFEAYRHVLEGLKEMRYGFSMSRYLVECQTQVKPPRYLMSYGGFRGMDLRSLLKTGSKFDASAVSVINPRTWPPLEETIFNSFQLEAVRTALTKELAIIQGPPGTGKTYVGLKVAEVLLRNDHLFSGPILVVCYTNHALDQFLEGIMRFCDNIVRVGSRCKNPELKRFNLKEIRAQIRRRERNHIVSQEVRSDLYFSHQSISFLSDEIRQLFKSLSRASDNILTERTLNSFMPTTHYQSLVNKVIRYQETHLNDVMMDWLTLGTVSKREEGRNINEYDSVAREVKLLILNGKSTCSDEEVDAGMVSSLPAMVRARLYRFWLTKVISHLQDQAREATQEGQDPDGIMELLDEANNEILPDHLLKPMMKEDLYNSISTLTEYSHYSIYTIRSWLGLNKEWPGDTLELESLYEQLLEDSSSKTQGEDQEYQEFVDGARPHFQPPGKDMGGSESPEGRDTFKMTSSTPAGIDHNTGLINSKKEKQAFFREERTRPRSSKRDSLMRDLSAILQTISTKDETNDDNVEEVADVLQRERMLDDDDDDDDYDNDDYDGGLSFNYQGRFARKKHFLFPPSERICQSESLVDVADDEWTAPRPQKKKQVRELQYLLKSATPMTEEEANNIKDLWDIRLKVEDKVRLYLFWVKKYRQRLMNEISFSAEILSDQSKQLTELKFRRDAEILRTASVVGMTTTGAARCRKVLAALRCPVVILEEAAEVLEAHVVTTLHSTCQHVILIGDHQQLRPSPTVFELCRDYNLDVSLFERLINNELPHTTLAVQHRMRPEIGRLMRHIYPNLLDHEDTTTRPNIRGVKHNVFFFQHEAEETNDGETSSKSNQHEAEICLALCRYFMKQGYEPSTITILAAYTGQVLAFKKLIDSQGTFFKDVRVTAIDNYQGEENDIIILSLVRNNDDGSVGFLKTDNRVCVALSRARNGLYAFGNFRMLAEKSELWKKIVSTATQHGQLGVELTIRCENHPDKQIKVTSAEDFNNAPEGGCMLRCSARLQCGHTCELICHGHDRDHEHYVCKKKCARILCKEQHVCPKSCFENCGDCMKVVDKTLPWCFHTVQLPCSADIWTWLCTEPCNETFPCGHMCVGRCGLCREQSAHVCQEKVERTLPCGHVIETLCCNDVNNLECTAPCQEKLDCGHECVGTCGQCLRGRAHVTCGATCNKRLEGCGHKCPLPCGSRCLPCKRNCWFSCKHQTHMQPCCDVSQAACPSPCPWECHHKLCSSQCQNPCFPCPRPCQKKLECGHKCRGYCKECCVCFQCDRGRFVDLVVPNQPHLNAYTRLIKLPRCKHVFLADTLDVYVDSKLSTMSGAGVLRCPACSEPVGAGDCWRFHHRLRLLQTRGEEGKKKLTRETTLSPGRLSKIERSLGMLSLDAKQKGRFGFVVPLPYFENWINVNLAFALTNQIKLVKVTETIVELLKDFQTQDDSFTALGEALEVARSTSSLQNILLQPANVMSGQRCRELTREVRRLAYLAMLCCAMCICQNDSASDLEPLKTQINACLDTLKDKKQAGVCTRTEIEAVFQMCDARLSDLWKFTAKLARQLSILDEPPDVDLCDIAT